LINGKALTCKLPDVPEGDSFEAECYLRGRDLSLWLVTNGWAHASANGPYENEGAQAKQNRRGIYGDPERGVATVDP
jgi:endonuclease YncB( thermonuclease family)